MGQGSQAANLPRVANPREVLWMEEQGYFAAASTGAAPDAFAHGAEP